MHCRFDMTVAVNQKQPHQSGKRWSGINYCSDNVFSFCFCVCPPERQPDPDPCGEGDPSGVRPVPVALSSLHAFYPGGVGSVHHFLLRAPALPPPHEGEAGQPGDRYQY